jgi:hypothetical protein
MSDDERPGPEVSPQRGHQIMAMLLLLHLAPDANEAAATMQAMTALSIVCWGMNQKRLKEELMTCKRLMTSHQGRFTFWFTGSTLEFDYTCTPPENN